MAKAFPTDNPFLRGYYAPVNTEADAAHLHITGDMPKELCGTLYRNGPNPQFAPRGPYHWFGGDGMIHAFHIENGNVSYRNRWVRTKAFLEEARAGEALWTGVTERPDFTNPRGPFKDTQTGECITAAVKNTEFPPFKAENMTINYPFILR